jgi:hypothetical protein
VGPAIPNKDIYHWRTFFVEIHDKSSLETKAPSYSFWVIFEAHSPHSGKALLQEHSLNLRMQQNCQPDNDDSFRKSTIARTQFEFAHATELPTR